MKDIFRWALQVLVGLVLFGANSRCSYANELKVVNAMGLIRAVKVIRAPVSLRIQIQDLPVDTSSKSGEMISCVAVNTDGLASERIVQADKNRNCIFRNMTAGTWQIQVQGAKEWRVFFDE
jgi:hypothetical protein